MQIYRGRKHREQCQEVLTAVCIPLVELILDQPICKQRLTFFPMHLYPGLVTYFVCKPVQNESVGIFVQKILSFKLVTI